MNSKEYKFIKDNLYYGIYTDNTEPIIDICKRVIRSYNNKKVLYERLFDILYPNQYTSEERIKHDAAVFAALMHGTRPNHYSKLII